MKVSELMTKNVVQIHPEESADVAARTLCRHNIGALPVCSDSGRLCGVVTDRDLVTRCMAPQLQPASTRVKDVMTKQVVSIQPDMDVRTAAFLMDYRQLRRLPVTENGKVCGMLSLTDLMSASEETEENVKKEAAGNVGKTAK